MDKSTIKDFKKSIKMEKITWPESKKVLNQFIITLVGIFLLVAFFWVADKIISILLSYIY